MKTHDFTVDAADGSTQRLSDYAGKVLLVVNTASKCGLTPQYEGLEKLYREYHDQGLEVLGFPSNQFGGQEPLSNEEIQEFCSVNFDVSFPVFAKVDVNGPAASPLFDRLKSEAPGLMGSRAIKWNFTKFLVGPDGEVVKRYAPQTAPAEIAGDIEKLLAA